MKLRPNILFTIFLTVVFAFALISLRGFPPGAQIYPLVAIVPGIILCLIQLRIDFRGEADTTDYVDIAIDRSIEARVAFKRTLRFLGWFAGLYIGIWLLGFTAATALFFILFLRLEGRSKWLTIMVLTAAAILVFVYSLAVLDIRWPQGFIQRWVQFPF